MIKRITVILFFPFILCSQENITIKQLEGRINTNNTEISFLQINDTLAFFSGMSDIENFKSSIYYTIKHSDKWSQRRYSKYNLNNFDTGEITFSNNNMAVFTSCNRDNQCKLVLASHNNFSEIESINKKGGKNTQAHFSIHNLQEVLYFVSDRAGGVGGLDIWLSIVDKKGNFGRPINAGANINTSADEVTPFFNKNTGEMYFSSNRKDGIGGFDIYKAEGKLNLWRHTQNVKELNTAKDEMYLTFYNKNAGYLASNRKGAKFENTEYCCNDVFSFEYQVENEKSGDVFSDASKYLPIALYFHNSEPHDINMGTKTKKTYKDMYISYFKMKDKYYRENKNTNDFFEQKLKFNFNKLNLMLDDLLLQLINGAKISLQLQGYASPLHTYEYNQALSERRISSVLNYFHEYSKGELTDYLNSGALTIKMLSFGESRALEGVSDNPNKIEESVYSVEAMNERKIEIINIILDNKDTGTFNNKTN